MKSRIKQIEKAINNMSDDKFNELLNELGIKEEQWVPEHGEFYRYVNNGGYIGGDSRWANDTYDNYRLLMNNVFKTEEEAEAQRDFDIEKAKLIKEIKDSSDVIDWNDNQIKYFLSCEVIDEDLYVSQCRLYRNQGTTHTTNKAFLENLIANEPERVKKYLFEVKGETK